MRYFLVLFFFSVSLQAQIKATTENGKKVILNTDGRWQYESEVKLSPNNKIYDCSKIRTDEYLKNNVTEKSSPLILINTSPDIAIMLTKISDYVLEITMYPDKKFCINNYNVVYIQLNDGSIIYSGNQHDNCDGVNYLIFTKEDFSKLKNGVITISAHTKDYGEILCYLNEDQNEQIRTYMNCLYN